MILLTGFTAFGRFAENPSATLAAASGRPFRTIEVAFAAADAFLESVDPDTFDVLLMLGVAGTSSTFRVERVARNAVGPAPDVRGVVPGSPLIDPAAPPTLIGTLWPGVALRLDSTIVESDDAGTYLCNYLYFRALQRFPTRRIGFLHVPPVESMRIDRQMNVLTRLLEALTIPRG